MLPMFGWFSEASTLASRSKRASPVGVGRERLGQDFERYVPVELRVAGLPHFTHPAFADLGGDGIRAEGGTGREGHQFVGTRRLSSSTQLRTTVTVVLNSDPES